MTLDEILKPVKWVDKQVLRQYTQVGRKLKLDEGERRYWAGLGLNLASVPISGPSVRALIGPVFGIGALTVTGMVDYVYNNLGLMGIVRNENVSDTKAVNPIIPFFQKYNSMIRFPTLVAGVGMVGKYGIDLFNNLVDGVLMDADSHHYLNYGLGLISVSSSMYIKEMDQKLLDRAPFWKTVHNWTKEKVKSLAPQPVPQPAPNASFSLESLDKQIENYI